MEWSEGLGDEHSKDVAVSDSGLETYSCEEMVPVVR